MAAHTKLRISPAVHSGSPSTSQIPPLRGAHLRLRICRHSLLASHYNGRGRPTTVGFLIHGSAIKTNCNPQLFNHLRNSNRRLKGVYRAGSRSVGGLSVFAPCSEDTCAFARRNGLGPGLFDALQSRRDRSVEEVLFTKLSRAVVCSIDSVSPSAKLTHTDFTQLE